MILIWQCFLFCLDHHLWHNFAQTQVAVNHSIQPLSHKLPLISTQTVHVAVGYCLLHQQHLTKFVQIPYVSNPLMIKTRPFSIWWTLVPRVALGLDKSATITSWHIQITFTLMKTLRVMVQTITLVRLFLQVPNTYPCPLTLSRLHWLSSRSTTSFTLYNDIPWCSFLKPYIAIPICKWSHCPSKWLYETNWPSSNFNCWVSSQSAQW